MSMESRPSPSPYSCASGSMSSGLISRLSSVTSKAASSRSRSLSAVFMSHLASRAPAAAEKPRILTSRPSRTRMNHTPSPAPQEAPVRVPHGPLPAYYVPTDAQAREAFLRSTFDDTAVDYNRLEKILGLGSGSWYRRQAL